MALKSNLNSNLNPPMNLKSLLARPWLALALALLILLTRSQHFGWAHSLPDASLAAFFLAGMWIASGWVFAALLLVAALADQVAFASNVSDWCVTAAYACLIPAYGVMWFAGKFCRDVNTLNVQNAVRLAASLSIGCVAYFAISNESFYWLSGYFANMSWSEYWTRTIKYFPWYLIWASVYVVGACIAALLIRRLIGSHAVARSR